MSMSLNVKQSGYREWTMTMMMIMMITDDEWWVMMRDDDGDVDR